MKRRLDEGDSLLLPVIGRHRSELEALVYRKGEIVIRAFSVVHQKGRKLKDLKGMKLTRPSDTDPETMKPHKEATRQLIRDWLKRNHIPRSSVKIEGREIDQDYGDASRFMAWALCLKPVTILVPPPGDDFWKKLT